MSDEERFAEARHKHRSDMTTIFIYERSSHKNSQFAYQKKIKRESLTHRLRKNKNDIQQCCAMYSEHIKRYQQRAEHMWRVCGVRGKSSVGVH